MQAQASIDLSLIKQWLTSDYSIADVEKELQQKGVEVTDIEQYLQAFKKLRLTKRQNKGFVFLVTGSFLGFLSFVLTAAGIIPALHDFFLYGITLFSIAFILIGLYFILEN